MKLRFIRENAAGQIETYYEDVTHCALCGEQLPEDHPAQLCRRCMADACEADEARGDKEHDH